MSERYDHNGVMGWGYQHDYNGGRKFRFTFQDPPTDLPGTMLWHQNYFASFMTFNALRFNRAAFFDAWAESQIATMARQAAAKHIVGSDHCTAQSGQFLPWTQARLWNARLQSDGLVTCEPVWAGARTPAEGVIATPFGKVTLKWNPDRSVSSSDPRVTVTKPHLLE